MTKYLYGLHDTGGEYLMADRPGYIVITEAIGHDPHDSSGRDYRYLSNAGYGVLVRLNNAHNGVDGTIPTSSHYREFAERCANYARNSQGVTAYIIGNEPNHAQERPHGDFIWPQMYADCFNQCYAEMKGKRVDDIQVLPAPIAPWDATTKYPSNQDGDWVVYFGDVLNAIPYCDGVVLHTYTHGAGIHLITSEARMQPPFAHRHYEFRAYRDFLAAVPKDKRGLPVYITETDQIDPWVNANIGWVQAAYGEIDAWNQQQGTQKIYCLCLYRWSKDDKWAISDKPGVHQDFQAAIGRGYTSPVNGTSANVPEEIHLPYIPNEAPTTPPKLPREWDERLTQRGVRVETPNVAPGQQYWRVKAAQWYDEKQAGGRHHIYVDAPDGTPFRVEWPNGNASGKTNGRGGFDAGNFPMSPSLNEFSVNIADGKPSERLVGIGMGANGNPGHHTSTGVTFELATMPEQVTPPTKPPVVEKPTEPQEPSMPADENWKRSREFVARWEGGYQNIHNDAGNWTGGRVGEGENKGTKYGISAASYPHLDIKNLTKEQADAIYFRDYWQASGADKLPWPLSLLVFDTAVLHGTGTAKKWLQEVGPNPYDFAAKRLRVYTKMNNWDYWGKGWTNRVANLLEEMA